MQNYLSKKSAYYIGWIYVTVGYNKKNMEILSDIWNEKEHALKCPKCNSQMVIVQVEPIYDAQNAFVPYDTIIECTKCDFKVRAESFTILGSVKSFDVRHIEIASWSPSGSRVVSNYEHLLDYELLKELKESEALEEFLVINNQVVQVIGKKL
jgi:hypothetical protein